MYPVISENDKFTVTETYFEMNDGVKLYTRIAVPKGIDKCPLVFMRSPYENALSVPFNPDVYNDNQFLISGYAFIFQHVRGKGGSEGHCIPYKAEREDGLRSLEIIRTLPFYNGEIYLYGASYLASAHMAYLVPTPKDIKGACLLIQTDKNFIRTYRNGCNYKFSNLSWWLQMINHRYPDLKIEDPVKRPYKDIMKRLVGKDIPEYTGTLMNTTFEGFWETAQNPAVAEHLDIPVLFVDGWFDFYLEGMFDMWRRVPEKTKEISSMIVGPWGHAYEVCGHTNYPMENGDIPQDFCVKWFDSIRNRTEFPYSKKGKINYYSTGSDRWIESDFPSSPKEMKRLYFNKKSLSDTEQITGKSSFTYNPDEPLDYFYYDCIRKAKPVDICRGKMLAFESAPFDKDTDIYGNIRWHINVSTDCEDTAFFIRIYLVENGDAYNLTETITSLSHICPDYKENDICTIDLNLPPCGFTVKKGASIRAVISSDGGVYVPHANVKGHWAEVTETRIARNTVYMEDSFIELPLK